MIKSTPSKISSQGTDWRFLQRAQARAEELIAALAAFSPTLLARADEVIE
jgi:hypothetical protein